MNTIEAIKKRIREEGLSRELHLELIQAKRKEKGLSPYVPSAARKERG